VLYKFPGGTRAAARSGASDDMSALARRLRADYADDGGDLDFSDTAAFGAFAAASGIRVMGLDPGRVTLVAGREPLRDGSVAAYNLSHATWENLPGAPQRRRRAAAWMSANGTGGVDADPRVVAVRALTHKTTSSAELLAWAAADAAALDVVLAEKLKPRWANARFRAWQLRAGVLARSCGTMRAGRLEDGTAGVPLLAMYGDAKLSGSSRGRRAGPTTALFASFVNVLGAGHVKLTDECGSTLACKAKKCGATLQDVYHDGPSARQRAYDAAKAARFAALGPPCPPRPPGRLWRDCASVRRCVNFDGSAAGGGGTPCPDAGRYVSRDGGAALHIGVRGMIDVCGLPVPAHLRRAATRRAKPPPLCIERARG
jgi:hypothetical protein